MSKMASSAGVSAGKHESKAPGSIPRSSPTSRPPRYPQSPQHRPSPGSKPRRKSLDERSRQQIAQHVAVDSASRPARPRSLPSVADEGPGIDSGCSAGVAVNTIDGGMHEGRRPGSRGGELDDTIVKILSEREPGLGVESEYLVLFETPGENGECVEWVRRSHIKGEDAAALIDQFRIGAGNTQGA